MSQLIQSGRKGVNSFFHCLLLHLDTQWIGWCPQILKKKKKKSECALLSLLILGLRKMRYRRHQSKATHFQL